MKANIQSNDGNDFDNIAKINEVAAFSTSVETLNDDIEDVRNRKINNNHNNDNEVMKDNVKYYDDSDDDLDSEISNIKVQTFQKSDKSTKNDQQTSRKQQQKQKQVNKNQKQTKIQKLEDEDEDENEGFDEDEDEDEEDQQNNIVQKCVAIYSYTANPADPKEISFTEGEIMDVVDDRGKWWHVAVTRKRKDGVDNVVRGIIPSNYVKVM